MTFPIFGSECAPGVLDTRPTVEPGAIQINAVAIDLVRPFGLDRLPSSRRLVAQLTVSDPRHGEQPAADRVVSAE